MPFIEMDPDVIRKILEGQKDILTPLAEQREARYRRLTCPCCQSNDLKPVARTNSDGEIVVDGIIPHHRFECRVCDCYWDPETDLVLRTGNPPASILSSE